MLQANTIHRKPTAVDTARKGTALLGGLLRCSHWGWKMFVGYAKNKKQPRYPCLYIYAFTISFLSRIPHIKDGCLCFMKTK